MQALPPLRCPFSQTSLVERRVNTDLATVSLDLIKAQFDAQSLAERVSYLSPPMSRSSPPSDPAKIPPSSEPPQQDKSGQPRRVRSNPSLGSYLQIAEPSRLDDWRGQGTWPGAEPLRSDRPGGTIPVQGGLEQVRGAPLERHGPSTSPTTHRTPFASQASLPSPRSARRAKAHVPSACVNCKRKHLRCEQRRPCHRCVQAGKESSCVDVEHKKRGRPRLRDERDPRAEGSSVEHHVPSSHLGLPFVTPVLAAPGRGHHRAQSYRELRSQPGAYSHPPPMALAPSPSYDLGPFRPSAPHLEGTPIALLSIDLMVARVNHPFQEALALAVNVRGKPLLELVSPNHTTEIQTLQSQLRSERDTKDPTYLPPIHGSAHDLDSISAIDDSELQRATRGTMERKAYWAFRTSSGHPRNLHCTIRLARTSFFFVVLLLLPASQYSGPSSSLYNLDDSQRQLQLSPVAGSITRSPVLGQVGQHRPFSSGSSQAGSPYFSPTGPNLSPEMHLLNIPRSTHQEEGRSHQAYFSHHQVPSVTSAPASHTSGGSPPVPPAEPSSHSRQRSQDLRHLELPPIQGAAPSTRNVHGQRRTHGEHEAQEQYSDELPHSGGRKRKRQRVGIEEMLG